MKSIENLVRAEKQKMKDRGEDMKLSTVKVLKSKVMLTLFDNKELTQQEKDVLAAIGLNCENFPLFKRARKEGASFAFHAEDTLSWEIGHSFQQYGTYSFSKEKQLRAYLEEGGPLFKGIPGRGGASLCEIDYKNSFFREIPISLYEDTVLRECFTERGVDADKLKQFFYYYWEHMIREFSVEFYDKLSQKVPLPPSSMNDVIAYWSRSAISAPEATDASSKPPVRLSINDYEKEWNEFQEKILLFCQNQEKVFHNEEWQELEKKIHKTNFTQLPNGHIGESLFVLKSLLPDASLIPELMEYDLDTKKEESASYIGLKRAFFAIGFLNTLLNEGESRFSMWIQNSPDFIERHFNKAVQNIFQFNSASDVAPLLMSKMDLLEKLVQSPYFNEVSLGNMVIWAAGCEKSFALNTEEDHLYKRLQIICLENVKILSILQSHKMLKQCNMNGVDESMPWYAKISELVLEKSLLPSQSSILPLPSLKTERF